MVIKPKLQRRWSRPDKAAQIRRTGPGRIQTRNRATKNAQNDTPHKMGIGGGAGRGEQGGVMSGSSLVSRRVAPLIKGVGELQRFFLWEPSDHDIGSLSFGGWFKGNSQRNIVLLFLLVHRK